MTDLNNTKYVFGFCGTMVGLGDNNLVCPMLYYLCSTPVLSIDCYLNTATTEFYVQLNHIYNHTAFDFYSHGNAHPSADNQLNPKYRCGIYVQKNNNTNLESDNCAILLPKINDSDTGEIWVNALGDNEQYVPNPNAGDITYTNFRDYYVYSAEAQNTGFRLTNGLFFSRHNNRTAHRIKASGAYMFGFRFENSDDLNKFMTINADQSKVTIKKDFVPKYRFIQGLAPGSAIDKRYLISGDFSQLIGV